ncbi:MAG: hypothetical protein HFJ57_06755 [Clostridia bacterium]|nr:hypothetical protein [Clostridia bacterium]
MATKSFLKNIVIKNRKSASSFISALENAENKGRKKVTFNTPINTVKDKENIKKMFGV